MAVVAAMQECAGWSLLFGLSAVHATGWPAQPERGDFFRECAQPSSDVDAALQRAGSGSWRGDAAEGYLAANTQLAAAARQLADLDRQIATYVDHQADAIVAAQLGLGAVQDVLVAAYFRFLYLEIYAGMTWMLLLWACGLAVAMLMAGGVLLASGNGQSSFNARKVRALDYGAVTGVARQVIADCTAVGAGVPEPAVLEPAVPGLDATVRVPGSATATARQGARPVHGPVAAALR